MQNNKYILILGGYGYGNTGDEAQLNESIKLMNNNFKDYKYKIIVLTPNPEYTEKVHNCNVDLAPREAFFNSKSPDTIYWIKNKKEEKDVHDFLYTELEESMKQILGSKVSIKNKKNNKGKIEIEYYSRDELERIVDMIRSI